MNKKKFYILISLIIVIIAGLLFYFKTTKKEVEPEPVPLTKTVIPTDYSKEKDETVENDNQINALSSKLFIDLDNSEYLLDLISVDINQDGIDDQIVAVKKLLDPFLHLIFAVQNPISRKWERIHDIKTTITEPKSFNFYTMQLSNSLSLFIYSGITSDNQQVLSMQKITKQENDLKFEEVISLNADIKIQIQELESYDDDELIDFSSFKIYTYDADPNAPNTLNQVKTEYAWDYNTGKYEKGLTTVIPGEKIESKLLKELKTGDKESITEFLSGLWFKNINKQSDRNRSFYFDKKENVVIFNRTGIEEIYEIVSVNSLRYGLYLKTQNKSIPNIIRYVRVEVKGVDEIYIGIRENVKRIKYTAKSLWTGNYKKNLAEGNKKIKKMGAINKTKHIREILQKSRQAWTNSEQNNISFDNNNYRFEFYNKKESGLYNLLEVKNKTILQLRSNKKQNTFYLIKFTEKENLQSISLKKIKLKLNQIIELSDEEEIVLSREI